MSGSATDQLVAALMGAPQKDHAKNERSRRINAILERMIGGPIPESRNTLATMMGASSPIPDFERHATVETREELQARISALRKTVTHSEALLDALCSEGIAQTPLRISVTPNEGLSFDNLLRLNGILTSSRSVVIHLIVTARHALEEAEAEFRANFPQGRGRPRDPRPYRVADELARFYLRHRKEKPTYASGYRGTPAGAYTTALTDLFAVLGIKAGVRGPAQTAISSITDDELNDAQREFPALSEILFRRT